MKEFKKGDVVYLNSNPNMKFTVNAVVNYTGELEIEIVYFNEKNNRFEYQQFSPELLTIDKNSD